jgi:cation diffusion facilitator CzcD-associated flavoprotein CzcO
MSGLEAQAEDALERLAERVQRELALLSYPKRDWLLPRRTTAGDPIYDVLIVGGGQGGLATAFGLLRERVQNLLIIDENLLDHAGPWRSFARMQTLRTPKHVSGPELGVPSLTPQAWYEARHGAGSWNALDLIPKDAWAEYLAWYRRTLNIPVRAETRAGALAWRESERAWQVPVTQAGRDHTLYARRVVLATGIDGSGEWHVPAEIRAGLPRHRYAHTRDAIDFEALRGKRVAVLGAGASAFDNAATALERGAREVRVLFRREQLVAVNAYRWAEFVGFLKHLADLPDADKWRFVLRILRMGQLPPKDTLRRASALPGFHLHPGAAWRAIEEVAGGVVITTTSGVIETDFVIIGTGFITDLRKRPELALVEPHIARWADRYTPPEDERHEDLLRHPYLGRHFEFTEREPGRAPYLQYLYNYTFGCLLSLGFGGASISGMKYSIPRLVAGLTGSLFVEDRAQYYQSLCDFEERELE